MEGGTQQNQTGPGEASGTTCLTPNPPTPPRLTPNPTLLDSPPPTLTPSSNSPPPPLTPAPSLSASSHAPKAPPLHAHIPAPPKLTSTVNPALRTYSRPILPSPTGQRSKPPSSPTTNQSTGSPLAASSSSSGLSSHSSLPSATSSAQLSVSSSSFSASSHRNVAVSAKTSCCLTNGNTFTATSAPITPFHTPASPTSRQGPQANPMGIPGLVRANQSPSPVRQGVSQQALLLGKGLKGSGQDQVLLRAQMLQSLTLRPPPPGTLGIPPSLRLKPPLSAPPALARPRAPLFPPLRPRPQPSATATEGPPVPTRHLSVAPPVRAVPLRPRLHSPNGYRAPPPRPNPALQLTAANAATASAVQNPPLNKPQPLSQTSQSQKSAIPMAALSRFERTPSAARQLQIIALSSGRQGQHSAGNTHAAVQSHPSAAEPPPPVAAEKTFGGQSAQGKPSSRESLPLPASSTTVEEEGPVSEKEAELPRKPKEPRLAVVVVACDERSEVTMEGEGGRKSGTEKRRRPDKEGEEATTDPFENHAVKKLRLFFQNPETHRNSKQGPEPGRITQTSGQEDLCESMSTQSDNQSALSSLSSQSPPTSPTIAVAPSEPPPLSSPPARPDYLDLSQRSTEGTGGRQVLTHLVEGFVIKEGLQPFPVNRSSLLVREPVNPPPEVNGTNGDETSPFCGKRGHAHSFMRSNRFCSTSCAQGFNVRLTKRLRALSTGSRLDRPRPTLNRASSPRDLWSATWTVEDVTAFIHTLPGCSEVAEGFRLQEIDGQALLLLTEDHLMTSMNIKLGPALKICAHINALKNQ
ncbi:hypothetical protein NHX12_021039 [Muraenolepis orangiensis]|uniref:SAM domain-containing protein n=1 Tax=Muraenolepis orangiensis TaxID=630683 RepID=A0A9Q0IV51_9TELE|nr:hypothetical protein NHX12_021039 [Muraenolepis orangiensis]